MKKIFPILLAAVAVFSSCANVDENDRYIKIEASEAKRAILVEEFTGQKCINCPEAHEEIARIVKEYGEENVIPVSIHASALALYPSTKMVGLRTELGEEYYKAFNGNGVPAAYINRTGSLTSVVAQWANIIGSEISKTTPVTLSMANSYNADTRKLDIDIKATSSESLNGKLQVWILEDGIVCTQLFKGNKVDKNYVQNHVLRAAVNGSWGTEIALQAGAENNSKHSITLEPNWEAKNISVVAFVYNAEGVHQVIKKHINN